MKKSSHFLWILFTLLWCAVPFFQFYDFLTGNALLGHSDRLDFEFATRAHFFSQLRHGSLSLLYPNSILGVPLASHVHAGIFYWPNALHLIFDQMAAFRLLFVIHYLIFGIGWTLALRACNLKLPAALLAPTIMICSGLFFSFHLRVADLNSVAWSGFTVFLFIKALKLKHPVLAAAAGIIAAQGFYAGEPLAAGVYPLLAATMAFAAKPFFDIEFERKQVFKYFILTTIGVLVAIFPVLIQTSLFIPLTMRADGFLYDEALSHSSHFYRIIDLIVPGILPSPVSGASIIKTRIGFLKDWWYPSIGIGFPAFLLLIFGIKKHCKNTYGLFYLILPCLFIIVAQGSHLPGGGHFWLDIPVLKNLRYPEKFLRYPLIFATPLFALGFNVCLQKIQQLQEKSFSTSKKIPPVAVLILFIAAGIITILATLVPADLKSLSAIKPNPAIARLISENSLERPVRALVCEHGIPGIESKNPFWIDTRIYGLGMINGPEGLYSKTLTAIDCAWAVTNAASSWLGISHIITGAVDVEAQRVAIEALIGPFDFFSDDVSTVFVLKDSGPKVARFSRHFARKEMFSSFRKTTNYSMDLAQKEGLQQLEQDIALIDPRWELNRTGMPKRTEPRLDLVDQAKNCSGEDKAQIQMQSAADFSQFEFRHNFLCPGIVSIPWTFMPGWKILIDKVPVTGFWVGGVTLGFEVPAGLHSVEITNEPPFFAVTFLISICLQLLILWIGFRGWNRGSTKEI